MNPAEIAIVFLTVYSMIVSAALFYYFEECQVSNNAYDLVYKEREKQFYRAEEAECHLQKAKAEIITIRKALEQFEFQAKTATELANDYAGKLIAARKELKAFQPGQPTKEEIESVYRSCQS
jgi:Tfp pilus assembly protein PilO